MQQAPDINTDSGLQQKIIQYKRIYWLLMLIGTSMLASIIAYAFLSFSTNKRTFQQMDPALTIGSKLAVDSSGQLIAFPVYNERDSTVAIMVSTDSGGHFEQLGGPWKNTVQYGATTLISSIDIAPDNKSIVAIGYHYIYLKSSDEDSFTCINTLSFPGVDEYNNKGICFIPGTDSVYIYTWDKTIFCLSYKDYDSIFIGEMPIVGIESMIVNNDKHIIVSKNDSGGNRDGIFLNIINSDFKKYSVVQFNNRLNVPKETYLDSQPLPDIPKPVRDSTIKTSIDSTKK